MKRAPNTHLYPRKIEYPAVYVRQPGEIEIPPGDEEALNRAARQGSKKAS